MSISEKKELGRDQIIKNVGEQAKGFGFYHEDNKTV